MAAAPSSAWMRAAQAPNSPCVSACRACSPTAFGLFELVQLLENLSEAEIGLPEFDIEPLSGERARRR